MVTVCESFFCAIPQPTAFSSHRTYLRRMDVVELTSFNKNSKGHSLSLFIFSDSMEVSVSHVHAYTCDVWTNVCMYILQIAKRRSGHHGFGRPSTKPYRHLEFLPYAHIRFVVDFSEAEGNAIHVCVCICGSFLRDRL